MINKTSRILGIIVLVLGFLATSMGMKAQNVVLEGNTFVQQQSVGDSIKTEYYYQDSKGVKHPIFLSSKGKAYCWVKSKSGKMYKKYLPKITEAINKNRKEK